MKTLDLRKDVPWVPKPNEVSLVVSDELPPIELCTSAYVLAFQGDKLLMADLDRGLDIPGGHIDPGEAPEVAMRREAKEETGAVIGAAQLLCVQKVLVHGPRPEGYAYPYPESYQLIYLSIDFRQGPFEKDDDSRGAVLIDRNRAPEVAWLRDNRAVYDYALALATGAPTAAPVSSKAPQHS